jgi:hypothetical protein
MSGQRYVNTNSIPLAEGDQDSGHSTAACTLQTRLSRNTYSPEKCDEYVRRLYVCCLETDAVFNC